MESTPRLNSSSIKGSPLVGSSSTTPPSNREYLNDERYNGINTGRISSNSESPRLLESSPEPSSYSPDLNNKNKDNNENNNNNSTRRSSFGFLSKTRSRSRSRSLHDVAVVTTQDGHTILRKQKIKDQEEKLKQLREKERQARPPPVIPSHSPLPLLTSPSNNNHNSISTIDDDNRSITVSNFSRPFTPNSNMPLSNSMPFLNNINNKSPLQQSSSPNMKNQSGGYISTSTNDVNRHYSTISGSDVQTLSSTYRSPRRVRRKKEATPFNILIIGAKSSGKTTLINFLKSSLSGNNQQYNNDNNNNNSTSKLQSSSTNDNRFTSHYIENEYDGERVGITLWDSPGLEKNLIDLQISEIITFIESKFEETFMEESKVIRSTGNKDTHIHCVFLMFDPLNLDINLQANRVKANGNAFAQTKGLSGLNQDIDIQVMKGLYGKTTVIPIISKADTISSAHLQYLKKSVWITIQNEKLDPLDSLGIEDADEDDNGDDVDDDITDSDNNNNNNNNNESNLRAIQKTPERNKNNMLEIHNIDDSDVSEHNNNSNINNISKNGSPMGKTRSSVTTPSPGYKRPLSRGASHTLSSSTMLLQNEKGLEDMYIPFTLFSPDPYEFSIIGRRFPWGIADPFNPDHCDFLRLKDSIFSEWRSELRSAAREKWYEGWRTNRLAQGAQRSRSRSLAATNSQTGATGLRAAISGDSDRQPDDVIDEE